MREFLDNYKTPNPTVKKHFLVLFFLLFFGILVYLNMAHAKETKNTYPKIANYYLHHFITDKTAQELSKWDVIILDAENQINNPRAIQKIRELNPKIIILAYFQVEELSYNENGAQLTKLREYIKNTISEDWYLHDANGNRLSFWPGATMINITAYEKWNTFFPNFIKTKIISTNLWDGIFLDNLSTNISWLNNGNIDINNDGFQDSPDQIDLLWKQNMKDILSKTKTSTDNFIMVGNSASDLDVASYLNGRMFENFPTPWEGSGKWEDSMKLYINKFPEKNIEPKIYIINSNTNNSGKSEDYKKMRFGITSTLLGDGYFSFDFGDTNHGQTWYYDEYKTYLGEATSNSYNLLDLSKNIIKPGLWRRDFENGIVLVNSTDKKQRYVFKYETFEKIKGTQDSKVNSGNKINYVELNPNDGIILLKTEKEIYGSAYKNNSFTKIFDSNGTEKRNPFFHSENNYSANSIIIHSDIDGDNKKETLTTNNGVLTIYKNNQKKLEFYPYDKNFKLDINLAIGDVNGDSVNEIVTGAGSGGGPHVRIFDNRGNLISQFFAYDKKFKGGVSVAIGDVNGDSVNEIVTGAGSGGGPHVRIFDNRGNLISQFFAYDKKFKGGVSVAIGDVNGDSVNEIVTGAIQNGNSEIKTFNKDLEQINNFFAYEKNNKKIIQISTNDINNNNVSEILVSTRDF